ncbi:DUF5977 domain-containing protein [Flavobacterium sp. FlaQc-52]|jgi:hypothetical protein|uniref:DUF5977 domain-containing protein n=1 Tax=unclassified Flavobacterium TaxID=196869 RepID=UPI003756B45D
MANTGYKSFAWLEEYYQDDLSKTGQALKPNLATDPDYIAPVLDQTNCPSGARYYNTQLTKTVFKDNCNPGEITEGVELIVYANQFVSNINQADADNQAATWLENNAQIYANNSGVCRPQ